MEEQQTQNQEPPKGTAPETNKDAEENKAITYLSYLGLLFFGAAFSEKGK